MNTREVARALAARMPGRRNDLPTPLRKGTRVSVTIHGVTATGVVRGSYGTGTDASAFVELDGTGVVVDIPWAFLGKES